MVKHNYRDFKKNANASNFLGIRFGMFYSFYKIAGEKSAVMPQILRAKQYIHFLKWFKVNYQEYYNLYAVHIKVPTDDIRISIAIDYVAPEHKEQIMKVIDYYNNNSID